MANGRGKPLVLFADDEEVLHDLMRGLMHSHRVDVECVSDGAQALDSFRRTRHDVIIVDLMMPQMNGFEFLREVRAIDPRMKEKTIVVTGASKDTWRWFDRHSVAAFMRKPVDVRQLLDEVSRCLPGGKWPEISGSIGDANRR